MTEATVYKVDQRFNTPKWHETATLDPEAPCPPRMACGGASCAEHGRLCAFHGDEPDRCGWCHCRWSVIEQRDLHSCEKPSTWPSRDRKWRVAKAAQMRETARQRPQEVDQSTFCSHVDKEAAKAPETHGPSVSGSLGTREIVTVECNGCPRQFGVMIETVAFAKCSQCGQKASYVGPGKKGWN